MTYRLFSLVPLRRDGVEFTDPFAGKPERCSLPLLVPQNTVLNDPGDGPGDGGIRDQPFETGVSEDEVF